MRVHDDLRSFPLLSALSEETWQDVKRVIRQCFFRPGEYILHEGEEPIGLFMVIHGCVRLSCLAPDGREQVLGIIRGGENFNAVPVFDGQPNPATAQARSNVECLFIPRDHMLALVRNHPDLALVLLGEMASQLRKLMALVEDLAFRSVRERLARQLLIEGKSGMIHLTHKELAERIGTVREIAGRALRRLAEEQVIRLERGRIIILNPEALAAIAEIPSWNFGSRTST